MIGYTPVICTGQMRLILKLLKEQKRVRANTKKNWTIGDDNMVVFIIAWSVVMMSALSMSHYWKHKAEEYLDRANESANECVKLQHEVIFLRQKYEEAKRLGAFSDEPKNLER